MKQNVIVILLNMTVLICLVRLLYIFFLKSIGQSPDGSLEK